MLHKCPLTRRFGNHDHQSWPEMLPLPLPVDCDFDHTSTFTLVHCLAANLNMQVC